MSVEMVDGDKLASSSFPAPSPQAGGGSVLLVHARPSRLFPYLLVLMLADLLTPLLYDGRHSPSLDLDTKVIISVSCLRPTTMLRRPIASLPLSAGRGPVGCNEW